MLISDFAIKRPLVTVVSMLALVIFGLVALGKLKTDEFPEVAPPFVTVSLIYPGASPDGVETELIDPVEEKIAAISNVKQVQSKAYDGYGLIIIEFNFGKDLSDATQEIRDEISSIRADLPLEMEEPVIRKLNDTDRPIVSLAVASSTLTPAELTRLVDPSITRELRALPGVAEVQVFGNIERELTVELKPDALQASGVSVGEVVQALQLQNLAAPVGRVTSALEEKSIRLRGRLENAQEFANLVVAERAGRIIRLGQIAAVKDGTEEPRSLALYGRRNNESEAVGIDIKKSQGYSTTDVASRIAGRVAEIQKRLPRGTQINVIKDAGVRVDAAVDNVKMALVEGAILTVLVVFLFLNSWRSTVITGLALPVSVLASFIAVWALGFKLETMSLLGLSLAIGILIDDAIVVRENIVRHVEMGKDHYTAAREGTDEIGLAVAATTFSILAVFVPIGFMAGIGGQWFKPFALTIACSVLVSLFVSFSLDPMLSAYWPDPHVPEEKKAWITKKLDRFNHWFNAQANNYRKVIAWALDHRAAMVALTIGSLFAAFLLPGRGITGLLAALVGLAVLVFGLTRKGLPIVGRAALAIAGIAGFFMLPNLVPPVRQVGVGFFPEEDRSEMTIALETPPGSNLEYTRLKAEEAARMARARPEVEYTYTTLGSASGGAGAVDVGNVYVKLTPREDRSLSAEEFAHLMRQDAKKIAGVTLSVFTSDFGGGRKQLQIQLRGDEIGTLNRAAEMVKAEVETVPGAVDVGLSTKGQKPELDVELNRGVAGSLGITVGQVAQALRPAFAGIDAGDWEDPSGEVRDVQVRLSPESRQRASDIRQLPLTVMGPAGPTTVPLGQVATVRESQGPAIIDHLDRELVVNVELNTSGRGSGDVTNDIKARLDRMALPAGVRVSLGGDAEQQGEVFGQIFLALGTAVLLMYLILVLQFESFMDPLAILVSLPLSMIGVMLALAITGHTINIMSMIGIILLAGIVAKNAILLIDFAKWAREEKGMRLREALIEAGAIRLRPILMTTFALIAGMIPVALGRGEGAQFRAPLGVAVIGGVITSTFLTLLVIPTVYEIMDEVRTKLARRVGLTPPQTAEHPVPAMGD
jgi:hydrophobic/amphiphilic exporter-1 (mainly G- bacteria), HAE1 family